MPGKTATIVMAEEIEAYLSARPRAADTEEGIVSWWLSTHRDPRRCEEVKKALELLVARGSVVKRALGDGRCIYAVEEQ